MPSTPSDLSGRRRRLAFVYEPTSFAILALFEAAREVCDLLFVADVSRPDVEEVTKFLRRLGTLVDVSGLSVDEAASAIAAHEPDGILALADDALHWTADVAARLGLPFHSPETATRLTDKFAQRKALREGGLKVPGSWVLRADDPAPLRATTEAQVTFPAVLKPRRGEGSRNTFLVTSLEELRALLDEDVARGTAREYVLEEYIADARGPVAGEGFAGYVSVESFVSGGSICHLATNGRTPPAHPFRETGFFIPSALDAALEREVYDVAADAARALGIELGCLHTEIKLTPGGPVVIEVNGRIGGGVPEMLAAACAVQILTISMQLALGEGVPCPGPMPAQGVAYLLYVHAPGEIQTVTAIEGIAELEALDGVDEVILRRGPGRRVDWREGNHGHVLSVFGTVADHEALRELCARITATLRIVGT